MKFVKRTIGKLKTWFTKPQPVSDRNLINECKELIENFQAGLVIACDDKEVNIIVQCKTEEEALKFLLELTFSDYFVNVYNTVVKNFPNVESKYVQKVTEIVKEQEERDVLVLDDDSPMISPLSMGTLK